MTIDEMKTKKIAVVVGGLSTEAEVSRRSGEGVLKALLSKGYNAETVELVPETFAQQIREGGYDVVFNSLHGRYGEDGVIQGCLEMMGIPYTGPGVLSSAIGMDKVTSKCAFQGAGIKTAPFEYYILQGDMTVDDVVASIKKSPVLSLPVVVKSAAQGSSMGTVIVESEDQLKPALEESFKYGNAIIVEAFIDGDEFTVSVMDDLVFPIIQIVSSTGKYDYYSKYTPGVTKHLCPAPISDALTKEMQEEALKVFKLLQCKGVSRVDIMTDKAGHIYVLEINTVPGMTATSLVPDAAAAMGMSYADLCEKILLEASTGKF